MDNALSPEFSLGPIHQSGMPVGVFRITLFLGVEVADNVYSQGKVQRGARYLDFIV